MNKPLVENPPILENMEFLPLKAFRSFMNKDILLKYHSRFSFSVLIEELESKIQILDSELSSTFLGYLKELEAQLEQNTLDWKALKDHPSFKPIISLIFPSFFIKGQLGFIAAPFNKQQFAFETAGFSTLLNSDNWEVKMTMLKHKQSFDKKVLMAGASVLNKFYGQQIDSLFADLLVLRDSDSKIEKHYKFNIIQDYIKVKSVKPLKKLSRLQIQQLLNNLYDETLWLKYIPPENFLFEGFIIGYLSDVTNMEILSKVKELMADEKGKSDHEDNLEYLQILLRSFLNMPDLRLGSLQTGHDPWVESTSWSLLRKFDPSIMYPSFEDPTGAYGRVLKKGEAVIIEDLQKQEYLSPLEKVLVERDQKSLLLAPMRNAKGDIISIFELSSPKAYRFNQMTLIQLKETIELFAIGADRFIQEMNNAIRLTMQQEFTAIHPSVEWKFREVATQYYWDQTVNQKQGVLEPIVFKEVYPLYGQADIVGSSSLRNESIKIDMTDNFKRLSKVLQACSKKVSFDLLDLYKGKVDSFLERLDEKGFVSSDESVFVDLLTKEIHPLLRKLSKRFRQLPLDMINDYFEYLDPELNIVYRQRKAYEDSVSMLNKNISYFLNREEEKMQQILPHFFEKYETDGVEYNLYLGQSMLKNINFESFYLKDFRLWQLIIMCEITRLIGRVSKNFPVPLTTAQLIFVYSNPLSIRFHMDEKQFDVDGAYNVRYEILKKRIDKAYVRDTGQRLTQSGKLAIVWLQEKDRLEYLEYLQHLIQKGLILPEIEDLELEKMQGVEGLRALRVEVRVD